MVVPYGNITLKSGDLAYYDSFSGLLPCKVLKIEGESGTPSTRQECYLRLTKTVGAYKKGEIIASSGLHAVARRAVYGKYRNRIRLFWIQADGR